MRRLKCLIIEGGGALGVIPIHFLSMLPTDKQNLEKIDVLAGCSIGGCLTASLATGKTFGELDSVFQTRAKECFVKRCAAKINPLAVPVYRSDLLEAVLKDMIGDYKLGDVEKVYPNLKIVVPALDVTEDKYLVFSNLTHEYDDVPLLDIALMTSAAPSYYDCREFRGNAIIDAGLLDVTGAITAVTQIKKHLGIPFSAMDVLVLSTGLDIDNEPLTVKKYRKLNLIGVATDVLRAYATLGNQLANNSFLEGLGFHYYNYFNPCTNNGVLDDYKQIPDLVKQADKYRKEFLETYNYWLTL